MVVARMIFGVEFRLESPTENKIMFNGNYDVRVERILKCRKPQQSSACMNQA